MLRQFTVQRVTAVMLFVLIFVMATRAPTDTDTWWHLRSGEHILQQRAVYTTDPFSHTMAGQPWNYVGWLSQVILHLTYQTAGDAGLALLTALLATTGMGLVYRTCVGNVYVRAFALVLGAATAAVFWSARPHMASFVLSALVLYLLHVGRRGGRGRLWFIPLVMVLWANLHGGFAIGFILLLGTIAGESLGSLLNGSVSDAVSWRGVRQLVLISALSVVAVCINPYGPQVLGYPFQTVGIGVLQDFIQEWATPNFHERQFLPFAALLLSLYGAAGFSHLRLRWTDLVLTTGTALMALTAARNIALFAVVAVPVLTRHVDAILNERGWHIRTQAAARGAAGWVNLLLIVVILLGALLYVASVLSPQAVAAAQAERLPVRAAAWLNEAHPEGLMFNSYNWGGYLMFAAPDYPVFADGRTDLYDDVFLRAFLSTWHGLPGWEATLDTHHIGFVVIESDGLMANVMRSDDGWRPVYDDGQAVIFVRAETDAGL